MVKQIRTIFLTGAWLAAVALIWWDATTPHSELLHGGSPPVALLKLVVGGLVLGLPLTIPLIAFKLKGKIKWTWMWVASPSWLCLALLLYGFFTH
jgi:hypothetical protein